MSTLIQIKQYQSGEMEFQKATDEYNCEISRSAGYRNGRTAQIVKISS